MDAIDEGWMTVTRRDFLMHAKCKSNFKVGGCVKFGFGGFCLWWEIVEWEVGRL